MNKRVPTATVIAILKNYKEYITPQAYESLELSYAIGRAIESLKNEEKRNCWFEVALSLPTEQDADIDGVVLAQWSRGAVRKVMWKAVSRNWAQNNPKDSRGILIRWARMPEVDDP